MSKYTTEVRFICETAAGYDESQDGMTVEQVIQAAIPSVFNFNFPIFDENYRNVLETKILRHYYTREIGLETVGLWKLKLNTKLNEIMPYYNQLYKSELIEFNPMYDTDMSRSYKRTNDGTQKMTGDVRSDGTQEATHDGNSTAKSDGNDKQTTNQTGSGSATKKDAYSDTPQGALTNVENLTYLSNARIINDGKTETLNVTTDSTRGDTTTTDTSSTDTLDTTNNSSTSANTTINNLEDYTEYVKGKRGGENYSSLLRDFRDTFLNIDMLIINDLNDLFMGLW